MAHAHCMLDTKVYKYTLRICNIYFFSTTVIVSPKRPSDNFIRTFPVFFYVLWDVRIELIEVFQVFVYKRIYLCIWSIPYTPLGLEGRGVKSVGYTFGLFLTLFSVSKCKIIEKFWRKYWIVSFHCFTVHFSSLYIMIQLMHLFVIKH
jgi:hypothetical protein